jgi:hypothetical protein
MIGNHPLLPHHLLGPTKRPYERSQEEGEQGNGYHESSDRKAESATAKYLDHEPLL